MDDNTTSAYAHLYLGKNAEGPAPVFRDHSPEGVRLPGGPLVPWPDGAVFAVYFARESFPLAAEFDPEAPLDTWEFFDDTGWPLDLAAATRVGLADATKREFQVCPMAWHTWDNEDWQDARMFPLALGRVRRQTSRYHALAPHAPAPSVH
jgi:hypothetical protein